MVPSLTLFKSHIRVDFSDDDALLQHLLESATDIIVRGTNRTSDELLKMGDGTLPQPLQQAIMMLAAHWYNQPEAAAGTQMAAVPYGIEALTKPYRKLGYTQAE